MIKVAPILIFIFLASTLSANSIEKGKESFNSGDFEKAQKIFETIIDSDDGNADAHYWLGRTFFNLRNFEESTECFEDAIDLNENNADYYFWYGNSVGNEIQSANVFKQALMAGDVLDAYEKAIEIDSKHIGAHIGAAQFYLQAPGIMGGDIEKAKEEAQILEELGSKDGSLILIGILVKEDKLEEAENQYETFHSNFIDSTDNPTFYNNYGYFLLSRKKYDKAIQMFKRQVQLLPDWPNSYDSLGDGYKAAGQLQEALASYQKAVELDPDFEASRKNIEELKDETAEENN